MRDEFGSAVGSYMVRDTMLREYVDNEESGEFGGCNGVVRRDKNGLLGESIDDDEDRVGSARSGEFLYEVH